MGRVPEILQKLRGPSAHLSPGGGQQGGPGLRGLRWTLL